MNGLVRLVVVVILLGSNQVVLGYDRETHREIAEHAATRSSIDQVLKEQMAVRGGIRESFLGREVRQLIGDGGVAEDVPDVRALNHFHNPLLPWNQAGLRVLGVQVARSSVLWGQNSSQWPGGSFSWRDTRGYYLQALTAPTAAGRNLAFANTLRALGQLTHLAQDATVPAHARNDPHLIYDGYEAWVDRTRRTAATRGLFEALVNGDPVLPASSIFTPTGDAQAPVPMARLIDTDLYLGENSGVLIGNVTGTAEYTNGNFVSEDTIFRDFTLPRRESLGEGFLVGQGRGRRQYFPKVADGEPVEHFVAESALFKYLRFFGRLVGGYVLDDRVHQDYAELLLPRAVGYSAALLDYFFRGRLEVSSRPDLTNPDRTELQIVNRSAEPVGPGIILVYWDDASDVRRVVPGGLLVLTQMFPRDAVLPPVSVSLPEEAQRVVFVLQGKLGDEPDAVVGKVLEVGVEHIYLDGSTWVLRTPAGAFPLPFPDIPSQVKWGDRDNTLVALTWSAGGDGTFTAYRLNRSEGSATVPLKDGAVDVIPIGSWNLSSLALDANISVEFDRTMRYSQKISLAYWDGEGYVFAGTQVYGSPDLRNRKMFPVTLDWAHQPGANFDDYYWKVDDFGLNRNGEVILLVRVEMPHPFTDYVRVPVFSWDGVVTGTTFLWLGFEIPDSLHAVVNLSAGRLIAKTSQDQIKMRLVETREDPDLLVQAPYVPPCFGDDCPKPLRPPVGAVDPVIGGYTVRNTIDELKVEGFYAPELEALGLAVTALPVRSGTGYIPLWDDSKPRKPVASVEVKHTWAVPEPWPALVYDAKRSSGPTEGYTLMGWKLAPEVDYWVPFQWTAPLARADRLKGPSVTPSFHWVSLMQANRPWAMLFEEEYVPHYKFTTHLASRNEAFAFADQDLSTSYRLLEPSFLYRIDTGRFHRIGAALTPTGGPAPLAPGDPTRGEYHVVGRP